MNGDVTHLDETRVRRSFFGWQCRIRQLAVRRDGGRPSSGMRPYLTYGSEGETRSRVTVLIVKAEPHETTAQFRHLVQKTNDPAERYDGGVRMLAAAYYQKPEEFSDEITALFGPRSSLVARILQRGHCELDFEQYNQRYRFPCAVRRLMQSDPAFQATYWHNSLFNPAIPGDICVVGFRPDWSAAHADPPAV